MAGIHSIGPFRKHCFNITRSYKYLIFIKMKSVSLFPTRQTSRSGNHITVITLYSQFHIFSLIYIFCKIFQSLYIIFIRPLFSYCYTVGITERCITHPYYTVLFISLLSCLKSIFQRILVFCNINIFDKHHSSSCIVYRKICLLLQ